MYDARSRRPASASARASASAIALVILLGAGLLWYLPPAAPTAAEPGAANHAGDPNGDNAGRANAPAGAMNPTLGARPSKLDHQALAPSLEGTDVDGYLAADEHGNLIVVLGVRDFFDYFLSTVGEAPLEQVLAFMQAYARERLPESAVQQLMALLDDYMAYRRAATELYRQPLAPMAEQTPAYHLETLDRTFRDLQELRRQHMSDGAVHAFFDLEEQFGQYTLDRMAVEMDDQLSREEKTALLADLRSTLPEVLHSSEQHMTEDYERANSVRAILDADTDTAHKRAALAEYHEPEQVERIVEHLDKKRAFQERLEAYLAARQPLMSLSPEVREPRLAELRRQYFHTEQELVWARTYEARQP